MSSHFVWIEMLLGIIDEFVSFAFIQISQLFKVLNTNLIVSNLSILIFPDITYDIIGHKRSVFFESFAEIITIIQRFLFGFDDLVEISFTSYRSHPLASGRILSFNLIFTRRRGHYGLTYMTELVLMLVWTVVPITLMTLFYVNSITGALVVLMTWRVYIITKFVFIIDIRDVHIVVSRLPLEISEFGVVNIRATSKHIILFYF